MTPEMTVQEQAAAILDHWTDNPGSYNARTIGETCQVVTGCDPVELYARLFNQTGSHPAMIHKTLDEQTTRDMLEAITNA